MEGEIPRCLCVSQHKTLTDWLSPAVVVDEPKPNQITYALMASGGFF